MPAAIRWALLCSLVTMPVVYAAEPTEVHSGVTERPSPRIVLLSPERAGPGEQISIEGEHFSDDPALVTVLFNDQPAETHETASATGVLAIVPPGLPQGLVTVSVVVEGSASNAVEFIVDPRLAPRADTRQERDAGFRFGEVLIYYKGGKLSEPDLEALNQQYGLRVQQYYLDLRFYRALLSDPSPEQTLRIVDDLNADPRVESATTNAFAHPLR